MTELEKIAARNQLRAVRRQALHAWLAGCKGISPGKTTDIVQL